tara:strand:+ start:176 stop:340 length:165 start_codon:yes stop_codon:yes gene_type:complete
MNEEIKNLVRNTSNDAELGRRIRAIYNMLFGNSQSTQPHQEGKNSKDNRTLLND